MLGLIIAVSVLGLWVLSFIVIILFGLVCGINDNISSKEMALYFALSPFFAGVVLWIIIKDLFKTIFKRKKMVGEVK